MEKDIAQVERMFYNEVISSARPSVEVHMDYRKEVYYLLEHADGNIFKFLYDFLITIESRRRG